jgi:high-affinity Fe2+/Pb2+ permease
VIRPASASVSIVAIALLAPALAFACPVCTQQANDRNANAFSATTALLSFLPLTMIGGSIWWLRKNGYGEGEFIESDEQQDPEHGSD